MQAMFFFRRATILAALALSLGTHSTLWVPDAYAADDKGRRVLRASDFDTQAAYSEQMTQQAMEKRLEGIRLLKNLLQKAEGDRKAEMMLRLADYYFQQGRYLYLREMAAFDVIYERCFDDDNCNTEFLQADNAGSRKWQLSSIKLYQNIIKNYARYHRADQAQFFLGSALQDTGQIEEAADAFKTLVKMYPQSNYRPDAYVLIGEYYFDKNNAYGALKAFLKATAYKDSEKYPFALYKLGWCYYNVGDYAKGIDTMKMVVDVSMAQGNATRAIQLQDEALKDLVLFFADADAMNEAIEYFTKLGKQDLIKAMLMQLATTYFEQGKFEKAVDTYKRLILEDPNAKDCPDYQSEIIKAYRKVGQRERILAEVEVLLRTYGEQSSWARANASNPKAIAAANDTIEHELHKTASDFHNQAKILEKGRHRDHTEVYDLARQAYATYIRVFPNSPKGYNVHYEYGELLYKLKDFAGAYEEYMTVVRMDSQGTKSKFCAESAIFAAEEEVKKEGGGNASGKKTADAKKDIEPQDLSVWEQRLVTACKQYADLYPNDSKVRNAIYKSAYLLYNKYRFDEAAEQFNAIITKEPTSNQAKLSADLMLDSFVVREDWANLKKNAKIYYELDGLGDRRWKQGTYGVYEKSSFKLIEVNLEADENKAKAADSFVAFYEEFPESGTAAQALNNASVYFREVDRIDDSVRIRHILVEDPKFGPETKYYYAQIESLGGDYEKIANFERASFYFEKLWSLYPEERKKREKVAPDTLDGMRATAGDAIYTAAVFQTALGHWETGIDNYNQFIKNYPEDDRIAELRLRVAKIYEDNHKWQDAANVFKNFYERPTKGASAELTYAARLHHGQALIQIGKHADAMKVYEGTVKLFEKQLKDGLAAEGPHVEFVAEMMYMLAQPTLEKYLTLKIRGAEQNTSWFEPERDADDYQILDSSKFKRAKKAEDETLEKNLKGKMESLVEVQKTFQRVIDTGAGEWGLASAVVLGKAYENMGDTLLTADHPFYLTEEQLELYRMGIEDTAYVQEEKAVNTYRFALGKSFELTLYNENTEFSTRRLGELRPDDFPGLEEQLLESRYTSSKVRLFDPETSL